MVLDVLFKGVRPLWRSPQKTAFIDQRAAPMVKSVKWDTNTTSYGCLNAMLLSLMIPTVPRRTVAVGAYVCRA